MSNDFPISISFDKLPEGRNWKVGQSYRVRVVLKQVGIGEESATYEVIDATSLEREDKGRRYFTSESGSLKA